MAEADPARAGAMVPPETTTRPDAGPDWQVAPAAGDDPTASPPPLSAADLRAASVGRLLTMRVQRHPEARLINRPGDGAQLAAPGRHAVPLPISAQERALFDRLAEPLDLFAALTDAAADASAAFHRLVQLGAIVEVRRFA